MKFLLLALFAAAASASIAPLYTAEDRIVGDYIVVFKDEFDVEQGVATIKSTPSFSMGGKIDRVYKSALRGFAGSLAPNALELVRRQNFVKYVQEDQIMYASAVASWGLDRVDERSLTLDNSFSPRNRGRGVNVYVIDTGINPTHNDYGGRAYTDSSMDFVRNNNGGVDCNGHGSHCAGIIGGNTYGVANQVNLYGVRVLSCVASGSNSAVVEGMNWVVDHHVAPAVATMFLGGGANRAIDDAVVRMHNAGVTAVVAAGNDNASSSGYSPARESLAITVGATDSSDRRASFSNYGDGVDIFAPGVGIKSCWYDGDTSSNTISGTSMACSHVAGGAAIYLAQDPSLSPSGVASAIIAGATSNVLQDTARRRLNAVNKLLYVG